MFSKHLRYCLRERLSQKYLSTWCKKSSLSDLLESFLDIFFGWNIFSNMESLNHLPDRRFPSASPSFSPSLSSSRFYYLPDIISICLFVFLFILVIYKYRCCCKYQYCITKMIFCRVRPRVCNFAKNEEVDDLSHDKLEILVFRFEDTYESFLPALKYVLLITRFLSFCFVGGVPLIGKVDIY